MWLWLWDPDNQKTLAFLGGGVAALAGAAWTVFKFLHKKPSAVTTVMADRGGMAAGRDLNAATPPPISKPRPRSKPRR